MGNSINQTNRMIPPWLLEKVAHPPSAGAGVHGWLFSCARHLHAHLNEEAIIALLSASVLACGRPVPERELKDAVKNSREVAWRPTPADGTVDRGRSTAKAPGGVIPSADVERWPTPNAQMRQRAIMDASSYGVECIYDLWEKSPHRLEGMSSPDDWVDILFPGNPWLCIAKKHSADARSRLREKWSFNIDDCGLIVPSPMTGPSGINKSGVRSHRTLDNTGPRRWLVIEFDSGTADEQAAIHWHLSACAKACGWPPFALGVHSGSKSLHGWYGPVTTEEIARDLFAYARLLGADTATWTRCQLIRLPDGRRDDGAAQTVYYHDFQCTMNPSSSSSMPPAKPSESTLELTEKMIS